MSGEQAIKLDKDFTLHFDKWNFWVTRKVVITDEHHGRQTKHGGKTVERRVTGYYENFTDCMKEFIRKQPQFEEVNSITALMKCEKDGARHVKTWCADLNGAFKLIQQQIKSNSDVVTQLVKQINETLGNK